jgi:BASS family bile acid:Na+ symporter
MNRNDVITAAFQASLFLAVFSIGLKASLRDALYLFRHPRSLLASIISMTVVMPAFAVAAGLLLHLHPAVEIALVALSVAPVPPFLPLRIMKAGGKPAYTISLLVISAALSVFLIPLAVAVFARIYGVQTQRSPLDILPAAMLDVLLPLGLGMIARAWRPSLAKRLAGRLPPLAMALLFLSLLFILIGLRASVFNLASVPTFAALGGFALLGFLVGDVLGGLESGDRTVLAFATAMRHPGAALIAANGKTATDQIVFTSILMYLILGLFISRLYMAGRKRFEGGSRPTPSVPDSAGLTPV